MPFVTHKDAVRAALGHRDCAVVPYDQSSRSSAIELEACIELKRHLGIDTPTTCFLRSHAELEWPVMRRLGISTRFLRSIPASAWSRGGKDGEDELFIDAWNVPWRKKRGLQYFELDACPLASMGQDEILAMKWPPLVTEEILADLDAQAGLWGEREYALFCDQIGAGIFERAWYLRGFEQTLADLVLEPEWTRRYFEKILEHQVVGYRKILEVLEGRIFGILLTEDLASQDSQLMSLATYQETLLPVHRELIRAVQSGGTKVIFHSCGAVRPFIPDLLAAGVEILHPVQRSAAGMSPRLIKQEFGSDLVLWGGGCDTAFLLTATPAEVRKDVLDTLAVLARGGGFVYSTTHCIQPGTPPENLLAMADALAEWNGRDGHSGTGPGAGGGDCDRLRAGTGAGAGEEPRAGTGAGVCEGTSVGTSAGIIGEATHG